MVVILLCWLATRVNPSSERALIQVLTPPPDGVRWLVTSIWWIGSFGLIVAVAVLALVSHRWSVIRDCFISGAGAWVLCVLLGVVFGPDGGRSAAGAPHGFALGFPVARVAATVAVASAALPFLSRWLQRTIQVTVVLLAVAAIVSGSGLPIAVLASLALGVLATAIVHLIFGSPLGLVSAAEVTVLVNGLGIATSDVVPVPLQEWGVGRFTGTSRGDAIDIAVYGRDASDAQLLAKTARFLLYRDSGPTLTLTRRQQVEHEAYLTLLADRAGVRVSRVMAAGPSGPARDALLVTVPPQGRALAELPPYQLPPEATGERERERRGRRRGTGRRRRTAEAAGDGEVDDPTGTGPDTPRTVAGRRRRTDRRRRAHRRSPGRLLRPGDGACGPPASPTGPSRRDGRRHRRREERAGRHAGGHDGGHVPSSSTGTSPPPGRGGHGGRTRAGGGVRRHGCSRPTPSWPPCPSSSEPPSIP